MNEYTMDEMNMLCPDWQQRTRLLLGDEKMQRLHRSHVLVVGLGGVGAYAAEMLCRAGVGRLTLVDADTVQPTNLNRQLPALHSTLGRRKADVLAERFRDINPAVQLTVLPVFLDEGQIPALLDAATYDFIVDAIDTLAPKCCLIAEALKRRIVDEILYALLRDNTYANLLHSNGAYYKSAEMKTYHCGLSKAVRKRLQKMGIRHRVPVVFSTEQANLSAVCQVDDERNKKSTCGTISYLPAVFGCYLAEYVIRRL